MEPSSNLKKYYSKNPLKKICVKLFTEKIVKTISRLKIKNILDAGCGEGFIIRKVLKNIPDIKINGLDMNQDSIQFAKKILPNCKFTQGDIINMPYNNNSYDLIIALEILEHLKSPELALQELKRVTNNYCLISVPLEPYFSLGNLLSGKNIKQFGKEPEHLQLWNKKQIVNLVSQYFNILSVNVSFPWTIILGFAKKN